MGRWLLFGFLWGCIALSNATLLLFLPVCGFWILMGSRQIVPSLLRATAAALVLVATLAPWVYRNWIVFHTFIPIRGNLGAEMYAGSGPGSNGFAFIATLPLVERDPETIRYKSLGEVRYVKEQGEKAHAYLETHRAHYLEISLKRFYFYWASVPHPVEGSSFAEFGRELSYCFLSITGCLGLALSLKNRRPASGLFAWAFLLLPATYYFVTVAARFRHPLEPLIAIFSVYLFQSATSGWSIRKLSLRY